MSEAIVQSIETLLITAFNRLTAELQAETDKKRVDHLLVLALRARIPKALSTTPAPRSSRHRTHDADDLPLPAPKGQRDIAGGAGEATSVAEPVEASEEATKPQQGDSTAVTHNQQPPSTSVPITTKNEASPFLAAAGQGVSRFGARLSDAPITPTAPEAPTPADDEPAPSPRDSSLVAHHSAPSASDAAARPPTRAELLAMPIEELFKDDIAAFAAEIAELRAAKAPGPYVFATEYTVRENFHSHPRNADGTLQPLVEIPPGVRRPTPLEHILMKVSATAYEGQLFFKRRDFQDAEAARLARKASEPRQTRKRRSTSD